MEPIRYNSEFRTKVVLEYIKAGNNDDCKQLICLQYNLSLDQIKLWEALFLREFGNLIYKVEVARRKECN
jgi:hypothetical protein